MAPGKEKTHSILMIIFTAFDCYCETISVSLKKSNKKGVFFKKKQSKASGKKLMKKKTYERYGFLL